MQRRSLLTLGALSAATLLVCGGSLAFLQPGVQDDATLSSTGREVFAAVARAMLEGSLPRSPDAMRGLLARIDALVAALPPHAQQELSQLLALLASTPGRRALAGLAPSWSEATVPQLQVAFQAMRVSSISLRQQAYQALHDIVGAAFMSDESTWALLDYAGPLAV
jgi:hypothetical protein